MHVLDLSMRTCTYRDVLSDINLFYEVAAIQMASTVLPITSILPDSIIAWLIRCANAGSLNDRYAQMAYGQLMEYVNDAKQGTNHSKVRLCKTNLLLLFLI